MNFDRYSIYIHIPFCKSKCFYCNFTSFSGKESFIAEYVDALVAEINSTLSNKPDIFLESLYIGGGTPTVLSVSLINKIISAVLQYCKVDFLTEITIETNPGTVDKSYYKNLKSIGFNRVSIGAQSFNDKILSSINRIHSASDIEKTVKEFNSSGFENISIDLIHGLPGQTLMDWQDTLKKAVSLDVTHISAYGLKIEDNTYFGTHSPQNLPDEDTCVEMYKTTVNTLLENNYNQYEISNYSLKGYESKHNLRYWEGGQYFAFGLSAHGYIDGIRYANTDNLELYIKNPNNNKQTHLVSDIEKLEEAVFLGLRLTKGIDLEAFNHKYNYDFYVEKRDLINRFISYGFMIMDNNCLKFTTDGFLISNSILSEFLS